jgi:hypothetical protein
MFHLLPKVAHLGVLQESDVGANKRVKAVILGVDDLCPIAVTALADYLLHRLNPPRRYQ